MWSWWILNKHTHRQSGDNPGWNVCSPSSQKWTGWPQGKDVSPPNCLTSSGPLFFTHTLLNLQAAGDSLSDCYILTAILIPLFPGHMSPAQLLHKSFLGNLAACQGPWSAWRGITLNYSKSMLLPAVSPVNIGKQLAQHPLQVIPRTTKNN